MTLLEKHTPLRRQLIALISTSRSEQQVKYWWRHYLHLWELCAEVDYRLRKAGLQINSKDE